jgi:hypothetical protein
MQSSKPFHQLIFFFGLGGFPKGIQRGQGATYGATGSNRCAAFGEPRVDKVPSGFLSSSDSSVEVLPRRSAPPGQNSVGVLSEQPGQQCLQTGRYFGD